MPTPSTPSAPRADAQRNREAILAAGSEVLARRPDASLAEVARACGLTRTTVYAHFANREELLEALVRRAMDATVETIESTDPTHGPADEALLRVIAASWRQVANLAQLLGTASAVLGERMHELHAPVLDRLRALVRRGRRERRFRRDVPEAWLLSTYFALVHAAGDDVAAGTLAADEAEQALQRTLLGAFGATADLVDPSRRYDG
jgi:AcrR family transcriptional regulator